MYTAITEFCPVLDTTTVHPARIAAANGKRNPYDMGCAALTRALSMAWHVEAEGVSQPRWIRQANELTRIQLAIR